MKTLKHIINEKLILNKSTKQEYAYQPKDKLELIKLLQKLMDDRGPDADLNDIDVSNITNMSELFCGKDPHNIDISDWDVSNVTDMFKMFTGCTNFNSDLSSWDVSNVEDMSEMFYGCEKFNCDLSKWGVSNVKYMSFMFDGCKSLKNKPEWAK